MSFRNPNMSENKYHVPSERSKRKEHVCTTFLKQASASMKWTIRDFHLLQNESCHLLESSSFDSVENGVHTGTWKIKLYIKEEWVGLSFVHSEDFENNFVKGEAYIVDAEGKEANKKQVHKDKFPLKEIGFDDFVATSNLTESLLPNGNLTVHCTITVTFKNQTQCEIAQDENFGHGNSLHQDFSKLLKDSFLSDAVLLCGGKKFNVHKCVLAARSSVFSAMFTHEFKEKEENLVDITDIESEVLENLLSYIYTDKIPVCFTTSMATQLLKGADKYNLFELKAMCEEFLKKNLSNLSLFEVAVAADLHSLESLKEECINFMSAHGSEIVYSDNSKDLFQCAPQYLIEGVFKQLFVRETFQSNKPVFTSDGTQKMKSNIGTVFQFPNVAQPAIFGSAPVQFGITSETQSGFSFGASAVASTSSIFGGAKK